MPREISSGCHLETCPECKGKGTKRETRAYREHPGGIGPDTRYRATKLPAFPPGSGNLRTVKGTRPCGRCGGRGEIVVRNA